MARITFSSRVSSDDLAALFELRRVRWMVSYAIDHRRLERHRAEIPWKSSGGEWDIVVAIQRAFHHVEWSRYAFISRAACRNHAVMVC
jgi:hypothetical protein